MYITVKYGQNESMLCNPRCAVVNLLSSIKRRTGFSKQEEVILDLSDETGLIQELDRHRHEHADKFLASHATYILLRKVPPPTDTSPSPRGDAPTEPQYLSLLQDATKEYPDFHLHVHTVEKKLKKSRTKSQSPSPAGVKGLKGQRPKVARTPSRKR